MTAEAGKVLAGIEGKTKALVAVAEAEAAHVCDVCKTVWNTARAKV